MIRVATLLIITLCSLILPAHAVEIVVAESVVLDVNLSEGWTLHLDPPDALVREMALHVAHEPAAANASSEQIEKVTRKRMAANEAYLYHAASGAHLDIDFSLLDPGASAPAAKNLRNSAKFAAQSLEAEEDVAEMVSKVTATTLNGVDDVFLLSAEYQRHGRPTSFRGYIGYVEQYWFFLYFTAPGDAAEILQEMTSMIEHMTIRIVSR